MAALIRTQRQVNQAALVGFLLAVALVAGILGATIGARLSTTAGVAAQARQQTPTADWTSYGRAWQQQYEEQHPTVQATLNPGLVRSGIEWQRQYEEQHPSN
jgi:hypothetical protein